MAVHKNETIDCTKKTLLFCFPVGNPKTKMKIFFYLKALGGGGILFSFKEKLEKLNKFSFQRKHWVETIYLLIH